MVVASPVTRGGSTPAAHRIPPSTCWRKSGSEYDSVVWPSAVYQARPPAYRCDQAIGWSAPIAASPGAYVLSSSVASTRAPARGFDVNEYHSSVRLQRRGSRSVEGSRPLTTTVAVCTGGCLRK